jgi:hypothetical protein
MPDHLAKLEILEEIAGIGFHCAPKADCLRTSARLKSPRTF